MIIHYCGYSSQPYVEIYCTGQSHYVDWEQTSKISGVYSADKNLYAFDLRRVTCEKCLTKKAL